MDADVFSALHRPGYDVAVVWDYAEAGKLPDFGNDYDEICVVAWSLGVAAASVPLPFENKVTRRIAIAGTPNPVDDNEGIPRALFEATRKAVSASGMVRFYRRMAGGASAAAPFMTKAPRRTIESLCAELDVFLTPLPAGAPTARWDMAIITGRDAIFPAANQRRAWRHTPTIELDSPHLVDFQAIIDRFIVDKDYAGERFAHRRASYEAAAPVQTEMCELMARFINRQSLPEGDIVEAGCGTGLLSRRLDHSGRNLLLWDIADSDIAIPGARFRQCDAETAIRELAGNSVAAVVSASTVQWFNSPARFFEHCLRVLRPGGILSIGTYTAGNLGEVAAATGVSLELPSPEGWAGMLPDGLELIDMRSYRRRLTFDSAAGVFRHLSATGVNSLNRERSAATLRHALAAMPCGADGLFGATYHPCIFHAIKR